MDKQEFTSETYDFIVNHFGKERMQLRYEWLYDLMQNFIESESLQGKIHISEKTLNHVIIDYFVDIYRLKEFQEIEKVHDSKIYAYLSFWLLRHKALQIDGYEDENIIFVNERFVSELLIGYLFKEPENVSIAMDKRETISNFLETMLYYFKYRDYSAKSIEMIILAFEAGRGYQYSVDFEN